MSSTYSGGRWTSESELLSYAMRLEGMRFSDISSSIRSLDNSERRRTKGVAAKVIESDYFGIPANSYERPDFEELGIELKVSPLRFLPGPGLVNAKERNVIGMVDYHDLAEKPNWRDNQRLSCKLSKVLFVFYLHDFDLPASEWRIVHVFLWSPDSHEQNLIQEDYEIIRNRVLCGVRNREADNTFLATCPKHAGGFSQQSPSKSRLGSLSPHPRIAYAEKRGYCLRNNAVVSIIADSLGTSPLKKGRTFGILPSSFRVQIVG